MHAVLRVDLQAVGVVGVLHELIDAGRAVAAFGAGVFGQVDVDRYARILERQVRGLVLFVVGIGMGRRRATPWTKPTPFATSARRSLLPGWWLCTRARFHRPAAPK